MREASASENRLCSSSIRFERFIDNTKRPQTISAATSAHWRSKSAPDAGDPLGASWDSSLKPVTEDIPSSPTSKDTSLKPKRLSKKEQRTRLEQDVKRLRSKLKSQEAAKDILQQALARPSTVLIPSDCHYISQKTARLIRDIALLELEVVQLEQHLLSLYRRAFEVKINDQNSVSKVLNAEEEALQFNYAQSCLLATPVTAKKYLSGKLTSKSGVLIADKSISSRTSNEQIPNGIRDGSSTARKAKPNSSYSQPIQYSTSKKETKGSPSSVMAELWREVISAEPNTSSELSDEWPMAHNLESPNKLSEELVRCMAAIYSRLADPPISHASTAISPTSSSTSVSTFSSKEFQSEGWSPRWKMESPSTPPTDLQQRRNIGNSSPHASNISIHWINVENDRLHYAERILHNFRDIVRQLEKVDPSKLGHEEKLAFWINVYNALMMHAYLAYGIPRNHVKRALLLQKASYKIGAYSINALTIENSLLGCKPHRRAQWIQSLFSPVSKLVGAYRQAYALEKPEPLVCFALCCGGRSDPALRVYTAKYVHQELDVAKRDFLQANVTIKGGKVLVPRLLESFVRESSMGSLGLIEWVSQNVSESKRKELKAMVVKSKACKCIEWVPYNFNFRYMFVRDLVRWFPASHHQERLLEEM